MAFQNSAAGLPLISSSVLIPRTGEKSVTFVLLNSTLFSGNPFRGVRSETWVRLMQR